MQVVKIVVTFVMAMGLLFVAGCYGNRVTIESAQAVDPSEYGDLDSGSVGHDGFQLEDFMVACGAAVAFREDGAHIDAECGGWLIQIETYQVPSGLAEPFWCTQILLSKEGIASTYAFGHIEGAMPRVMSQPEMVFVRDANYQRPWRQRVEKAVLDDLIELMTSGHLLERSDDPLAGLSFSYQEIDVVSGEVTIHRPDGSETPMVGARSAEEA